MADVLQLIFIRCTSSFRIFQYHSWWGVSMNNVYMYFLCNYELQLNKVAICHFDFKMYPIKKNFLKYFWNLKNVYFQEHLRTAVLWLKKSTEVWFFATDTVYYSLIWIWKIFQGHYTIQLRLLNLNSRLKWL